MGKAEENVSIAEGIASQLRWIATQIASGNILSFAIAWNGLEVLVAGELGMAASEMILAARAAEAAAAPNAPAAKGVN